MLELLKEIADRSGGLTLADAERLCAVIPSSWYTTDCGYSKTSDDRFAKSLSRLFPAFSWRIILDRSGERSRWALTIDDNDPKEHYVPEGGVCIHCMKTAEELGVPERDDDGQEIEEHQHALSKRP